MGAGGCRTYPRVEAAASSRTSSSGNAPSHPLSTAPSGPKSTAAGWLRIPNAAHDSNVSSQYIGNEYVPVRSTNSVPSSALSWVPSPMTLT